MRPIVTDVAWSVCLCVLNTLVSSAEIADTADMAYGVCFMRPKEPCIRWGLDPPGKGKFWKQCDLLLTLQYSSHLLQLLQVSQHVLKTPEQIRPFPKAGARKRDANVKRKRVSRILTDTPEKQQIEQEQAERNAKKRVRKAGSKPATSSLSHKKPSAKVGVKKSGKKMKKAEDEACKECGVIYGDANDKKLHEMWRCCIKCIRWFHDSCAQGCGILDDGDVFTCGDCVT